MLRFSQNNIGYYIIIFSILILAYGFIPIHFAVFLVFLGSVLFTIDKKYNAVLLPFIIYPAMFATRAADPENLIIILLPDISVILALLYMFYVDGLKLKKNVFNILIILYLIATFIILTSHIKEAKLILAIVRQYIFPILFTIFFINFTTTRKFLIVKGYSLFYFSTALIVLVAIINYFNIFTISPSYSEVYPYSNFILQKETGREVGREMYDGFRVHRLNLLLGGGGGTSASIISAMILANISKSKLNIIILLILLIGILLTISFSILIPVVLFFSLMVYQKKNKYLFIIPLLFIIFTLMNAKIFQNLSPIEYFMNSILIDFITFIKESSWDEIFFGVGPKLTANQFTYSPQRFIIDIGILRIFTEGGFIAITLFIIILILILRKGLMSYSEGDNLSGKFLIIFLTIVFSVHGNYTIIPPFFLLFALCVAYLLKSINYYGEK